MYKFVQHSLSICIALGFEAFSDVVSDLYNYVHPKNHQKMPMVSDEFYEVVTKHADVS